MTSLSSSTKPILTFVTGNKNKLEEVKKILGESDLPFEITNEKVDVPELQGDPVEIAKEKCLLAAKEVKGPCITEDTCLCFNALNGMPGPYIKWFLESCGHNGLNKMLLGFDDKSAYAQTIVAFTTGVADSEIHIFDGRTNGKIVPPRGPLEFGWDPIFEPDEGNGKTYAEMSQDEKNAISHRGRSFAKFRSFLMAHKDILSAN
jgi:inosine triphosphate pyrophosphatase